MSFDDLKVRLPRDLKNWLKTRAEANCRTMNGEILAMLKSAREAEVNDEPKCDFR